MLGALLSRLASLNLSPTTTSAILREVSEQESDPKPGAREQMELEIRQGQVAVVHSPIFPLSLQPYLDRKLPHTPVEGALRKEPYVYPKRARYFWEKRPIFPLPLRPYLYRKEPHAHVGGALLIMLMPNEPC